MSETPAFVTPEIARVRYTAGLLAAMRSEGGAFDGTLQQAAAMLDAFAQRLEQEAHGEAILAKMQADWASKDISANAPDYAEKLREEGRREVLRKIAEIKYQLNSWLDDGCLIDGQQCAFCAQNAADGPHAPDCLYLRAQEAVKP